MQVTKALFSLPPVLLLPSDQPARRSDAVRNAAERCGVRAGRGDPGGSGSRACGAGGCGRLLCTWPAGRAAGGRIRVRLRGLQRHGTVASSAYGRRGLSRQRAGACVGMAHAKTGKCDWPDVVVIVAISSLARRGTPSRPREASTHQRVRPRPRRATGPTPERRRRRVIILNKDILSRGIPSKDEVARRAARTGSRCDGGDHAFIHYSHASSCPRMSCVSANTTQRDSHPTSPFRRPPPPGPTPPPRPSQGSTHLKATGNTRRCRPGRGPRRWHHPPGAATELR